MSKTWHILSFESTHAALAAQKLLEHLHPFVIPTPKVITANCGMSLRFNDDVVQEARNIIDNHPDIAQLSLWHVIDDTNINDTGDLPKETTNKLTPLLASLPITCFKLDGTFERTQDVIQAEHTLDVYVNEILTMRIVCSPNYLVKSIMSTEILATVKHIIFMC